MEMVMTQPGDSDIGTNTRDIGDDDDSGEGRRDVPSRNWSRNLVLFLACGVGTALSGCSVFLLFRRVRSECPGSVSEGRSTKAAGAMCKYINEMNKMNAILRESYVNANTFMLSRMKFPKAVEARNFVTRVWDSVEVVDGMRSRVLTEGYLGMVLNMINDMQPGEIRTGCVFHFEFDADDIRTVKIPPGNSASARLPGPMVFTFTLTDAEDMQKQVDFFRLQENQWWKMLEQWQKEGWRKRVSEMKKRTDLVHVQEEKWLDPTCTGEVPLFSTSRTTASELDDVLVYALQLMAHGVVLIVRAPDYDAYAFSPSGHATDLLKNLPWKHLSFGDD